MPDTARNTDWLDGYRYALTNLHQPGVLADAHRYVVENEDAELPRVPEPTPERDTASEVAADLQRHATQQDILTPARVFSDPLTPPPDDLRHVRDCHGDVWRRLPNDVWHTPETMPCGWPYMVKKWGPLVEVAPAPSEESR